MKERHKQSYQFHARETLKMLNIALGQDFHTLASSQVESLLDEAKRVRYQQPKNANGSRARYFHDKLQREAK